MYNSNYFNRNLIESMKNTLLKMVNEQEGGNLSMGRLTDAERAAGNARVADAQKSSAFDFSRKSNLDLENAMRQKKKTSLFKTYTDADQSEEWRAMKQELEARQNVQNAGPQREPLQRTTTKDGNMSGRERGIGPGKTAFTGKKAWDEITREDSGFKNWASRNKINPDDVDLERRDGKVYANGVEMTTASGKTSHFAPDAPSRFRRANPKTQAPAVTSDPAPQMVAAANYELTPEMQDDMRRNENQTGIRQAGLGSVTPAPGVGRPDMPFDAAFNPMGHSVKGRGLSTSDRAAAERAAAEFGSTGRTSPSTVGNSRTHSVTPGSAGRPDMPFHAQHNPQGYQPKGRGLNADEQEQARVAGQEFRNTGSVTPGRKATGSSPRGFVPTNPFM